jgi:cellulose synthase/poly-beta-1,6-N-acetylglucosamine synthase-like glycosyltransferase
MKREMLLRALSYLHILAWSIWWGGLTLYAAIVVPIATESIGALEQGFVTKKVTEWLHGCAAVYLATGIAVSAWRRSRWQIGLIVVQLVLLVSLVMVHSRLSAEMDFDLKTIPDGFYAKHAIYLWLTTGMWIVGLIYPLVALPLFGVFESRYRCSSSDPEPKST